MKTTVNKNLILAATEPKTVEYLISGGSHLTFILLADRPWFGKPKLKFTLAGADSRLDFYALVSGKGEGRYVFSTEIIHEAERTTSMQMIRSAMYEASSTDFEGNMVIKKNARGADAYMSHKALLMSPRARSNALPSMEIMANDVKAGHSSSTGKPDKEAMFYLQTRGLSGPAADNLLVDAFFMELADKVPEGKEKESVIEWLKKNPA